MHLLCTRKHTNAHENTDGSMHTAAARLEATITSTHMPLVMDDYITSLHTKREGVSAAVINETKSTLPRTCCQV
jgi:hypothetical protein